MTAPAHERLWRKVLNDPAATNEQRLEAAKRLEKSVLARKKIVKKAKVEVAEEEATAKAAEQDIYAGGDWSFLDMTDPANTAPPHIPQQPVCDVCGQHGGFRRLNGTDGCILHCGENRARV